MAELHYVRPDEGSACYTGGVTAPIFLQLVASASWPSYQPRRCCGSCQGIVPLMRGQEGTHLIVPMFRKSPAEVVLSRRRGTRRLQGCLRWVQTRRGSISACRAAPAFRFNPLESWQGSLQSRAGSSCPESVNDTTSLGKLHIVSYALWGRINGQMSRRPNACAVRLLHRPRRSSAWERYT
jgi:hypothetical protein